MCTLIISGALPCCPERVHVRARLDIDHRAVQTRAPDWILHLLKTQSRKNEDSI